MLAFTELQTEISDFSSDVGSASVPFFDYRNYTFKLLFPGKNLDHPILKMPTKNVRTIIHHFVCFCKQLLGDIWYFFVAHMLKFFLHQWSDYSVQK